jgi:hypothetical protein
VHLLHWAPVWAGCHERDEAWRRSARGGDTFLRDGYLSYVTLWFLSTPSLILGLLWSECYLAAVLPILHVSSRLSAPRRESLLSRPCVRRSLHQGIRTTRDGCVHSEGINRMASGCVRPCWSSGSHPADASMPFTQTNSLLAILLAMPLLMSRALESRGARVPHASPPFHIRRRGSG